MLLVIDLLADFLDRWPAAESAPRWSRRSAG
jgi:hypothetical protein